jgi:ADP-heptose:LPS heptosyltransferase
MTTEKRGHVLLRWIDQKLGSLILAILGIFLKIQRVWGVKKPIPSNSYLVVCFGAIGDLIILTRAVKTFLADQKVYLACSNLNYSSALLYTDFYAGIEPIDLKSPLSIYRVCKKFQINQIIDSTQWANIGPIMVGMASLLDTSIITRGFKSNNRFRNLTYNNIINHSQDIHEIGNFINLMIGGIKVTSNSQLPELMPDLYHPHPRKTTRKVLLHLWPAGSKAYLKEWPESNWEKIAYHLVKNGYQVCLSGSQSDALRTKNFIERSCLPLMNIAGMLDLKSLFEFIQTEIEFAVSVNTGVMHLLVEAKVPVIGLHGPTNPVRWGPLGSAPISLLPRSGPCAYLHYGFEYPKTDKLAYALNMLSVEQVIDAMTELSSRDN